MRKQIDVLMCASISEKPGGMYNLMFIDTDNIEGYVNAILNLAGNEKKRRLLAENGFNLIRKHSWNVAVKEYVGFMNKNLEAKKHE